MKPVLLLALWFHDAIYQPKLKDNEERSNHLFQKYAEEAEIEQCKQELVSKIIMATVKHDIGDDFKDKSSEEIHVCK